jgi:hypothetical protein
MCLLKSHEFIKKKIMHLSFSVLEINKKVVDKWMKVEMCKWMDDESSMDAMKKVKVRLFQKWTSCIENKLERHSL